MAGGGRSARRVVMADKSEEEVADFYINMFSVVACSKHAPHGAPLFKEERWEPLSADILWALKDEGEDTKCFSCDRDAAAEDADNG